MSLSIGIVGLPNVGKSTLFNALLKRQVALAANYPFATIEPNVGVVDVPDLRLEALADVVKKEYGQKGTREVPEKIIPAVVKFHDIAGLVKGASEGEGLGNQFLGHIREVDAIVHVVRDFEDPDIVRAGSISPQEDYETIRTELMLSDIQHLEAKMSKMEQLMKKDNTADNRRRMELYSNLLISLNNNSKYALEDLTEKDRLFIEELHLLSLKPELVVINTTERNLSNKVEHMGNKPFNEAIYISAMVEYELCSLTEADRSEYMQSLGISVSGLDKIIRRSYEMLDLITYFTAGPKEVRAWTIERGLSAPQAAGKIHSDFERGFISAEVVSYKDFAELGGWKNSRDAGKLRIEGKHYIVVDGDVMVFRFSV